MSNSFRIEILGQRGATTKVAIERSMPSPLAPIYELCDWMAFCDKIDETLKPMEGLKKKTRCIQIGLSGFVFCIFISSVIYAVISFQNESREERIIPAFVVAAILIIIVPALVALFAGKKIMAENDLVKEDLQRIINEQSSRRSDVR